MGMSDHPFDKAISLTPEAPGLFRGSSSDAYWNMVGPFGGITAATALSAVLQHPDLLGEPISMTVNYAGPVAPGPFTLKATAARTNRSTQHWVLELTQIVANGQEEVMLTGTVVTAARRSTWSNDDVPMPKVPPPDQVPVGSLFKSMAWINRYEMRFIEGEPPTDWNGGGDSSLSRLWMRDAPPRPLDFCSLASMADMFFPRVYLRRALRVPAGTVSMTVFFHASGPQLAESGDGYLLGQAHAHAFRNGFFDQTSQLWNEAGLLLATAHQIVYFKE